jgi:hypothetical protein
MHLLRDCSGDDCQLAHLFGLQTAGLSLGHAWTCGHAPEVE